MARAAFATIHLARFDRLRSIREAVAHNEPGTLFCAVAADTRAAATEPASGQAFTFLLLGLHESEASANQLFESRRNVVPWFDEACEVYGAVLQPTRHKGDANYLDSQHPGPLFETLAVPVSCNEPLISVTTSGWNADQPDWNRVRQFSTGVLAVRAGMTAVDGLHSQQSFFFAGGLTFDPVTLTFWRDDAAIRTFSYGPGLHRMQLDRQRQENLADRTSFTRYRVQRSMGTWYGVDPQACWAGKAAGAVS